MCLRLRTAALGDNDNQQSQLKKLAEALFCLTVYNTNTERAWEQCHPGTNEDPQLVEGVVTGQVWKNQSIKIDNYSNGL